MVNNDNNDTSNNIESNMDSFLLIYTILGDWGFSGNLPLNYFILLIYFSLLH